MEKRYLPFRLFHADWWDLPTEVDGDAEAADVSAVRAGSGPNNATARVANAREATARSEAKPP